MRALEVEGIEAEAGEDRDGAPVEEGDVGLPHSRQVGLAGDRRLDEARGAPLEGGREEAEGAAVQGAGAVVGGLSLLEALVREGRGRALNEGVGVHDV